MATAREDLTPEQEERRRRYAASYAALRRYRANPERVAALRRKIEQLRASPPAPVLDREAFLAATADTEPAE